MGKNLVTLMHSHTLTTRFEEPVFDSISVLVPRAGGAAMAVPEDS